MRLLVLVNHRLLHKDVMCHTVAVVRAVVQKSFLKPACPLALNLMPFASAQTAIL